MALNDAAVDATEIRLQAPLSLSLGISMAGFDFIETEIRRIVKKGNQSMLPTVVGCIHIASASTIAELIGLPCTLNVFSNSCVGGVDSIAKTFYELRDGKADIALAGGSDAPIETSLVAGFCAARMLCTDNAIPERASRPFDLNRSLGVLAEGSCVVVLETLDHAMDRGASIYAEIIGYGTASDPTPEAATGIEYSMLGALANASIGPTPIDFISAHAPSDAQIDLTETNAIKSVFKKRAYDIPINSIKGSTGNPLAAGGAMQVGTSAMILRNQLIPPTANYSVRDPDCDLDYVIKTPRSHGIEHVMVNSHGIGRVNSSLVMRRIDL